MSLVASDEISNLSDRKRCEGRITTEAQLVACPLNEGLDVFPDSRTNLDASLSSHKVDISLEMLIKFFKCDIQACRELVPKNVRRLR